MKKALVAVLAILLATSGVASAAQDWIEFGGDYRFRYDSLEGTTHEYVQFVPPGTFVPTGSYKVKNNSLMTNRFGLNVKADPMEDVVVKARFVMYKVFGHQSDKGYNPYFGPFFADRVGENDGTVGHVPGEGEINVDYAYATINNIFDLPIWFSIGRRPSTGGIPSNYRYNQEKTGTAGIPSIMVDYAFDGMTFGWAPDVDALPGMYAKLCYGRGYDSGYRSTGGVNPSGGNAGKDTDFIGLNLVPYDTDNLHVEIQYQRGKNIFDAPSDDSTNLSTNLGDIDWFGGVVTTKLGSLNLFAAAATSMTDPNGNTNAFGGGLLNNGPSTEERTGYAYYVGARLDMTKTTKIGVEYNHGSKYWIGMVPASDDVWTSKLGTRGDVYEVYLIHELGRKAIAKKAKAFIRLGYQYYDFEYTGSNNWVGAPIKISDLNQTNNTLAQFFVPLDKAQDIYATFEVQF